MKKTFLTVFLLAIFIVSALPCVSAGFAVNSQTSASAVKAEQWKRRKPDLTLTSDDVVFSPVSPTEGEAVTITATIHNTGEGWAWRVEVGFYDGETLIDIAKTGLIKAGGTGTASVEWTATPAGDHIIRVVADPGNKISETDETNNMAYKTISVTPVAPPLPPDLTLTSADIAFTPEAPVEGEAVTITATIHNIGEGAASNVVVGFYDGEPATEILIGTDTIASIATAGTGAASVDWIAVFGVHDIYVVADPYEAITESDETNNQAFKTIDVAEAPPPPPVVIEYELFIEIDYMGGHYPTEEVLDYIKTYYYEREISVTFYVDIYDEAGNLIYDDLNSEIVPYDPSVTDAKFWAIEAEFNDVIVYDDRAYGDPNKGVYTSKEKWVLFGTTVDGAPNVVGYTWVVIKQISWREADMVAGNYIYIADGTADSWAADNEIEAYGAEAVVLMHEMGHSIGIGKLKRSWRYGWVEVYDPDTYSVMSYLSVDNAGLYWAWYYSDEYWATRNMEYYAV